MTQDTHGAVPLGLCPAGLALVLPDRSSLICRVAVDSPVNGNPHYVEVSTGAYRSDLPADTLVAPVQLPAGVCRPLPERGTPFPTIRG